MRNNFGVHLFKIMTAISTTLTNRDHSASTLAEVMATLPCFFEEREFKTPWSSNSIHFVRQDTESFQLSRDSSRNCAWKPAESMADD